MYDRVSFLRDTKRIGDVAEIRVAAAMLEAGYRIFLPFGENHRYDLLAENESGGFVRVQVKTGRVKAGAVVFRCYSVHVGSNGAATMQRYAGQIDAFGIYCPDNGRSYLVPAAEVGSMGHLRVDACRNNQRRALRWASHYEIRSR